MRTSKTIRLLLFSIPAFLVSLTGMSQMITGSWKGRINRQKVEVKIIQTGDSLTGTSYYYESPSNYRRYSIKGYFDAGTNHVVWWDDQLIEEKTGRLTVFTPGKIPLLSRADFNCPGGGKMMLDGEVVLRSDETEPKGEVHLDKTDHPEFEDEWTFVIDNYTVGANDPEVIDSVEAISGRSVLEMPTVRVEPKMEPVVLNRPAEKPVAAKPEEQPVAIVTKEKTKPEPPQVIVVADKQPTIEEKFIKRQKLLVKEIPLTGDTLELRFYDNAEIDGDSISIFLNDRLIFQHIRLTGNAYTIKLPVSELAENNELIMVAENLGSIPPNTSYMLAITGEKRYDAYLASTEGSSAMIRFIKPPR